MTVQEGARQSGVLLHPTSLPGPYGIGTLGSAAYAWVDWLAEAGQQFWQVLPLGPVIYGDSPYSSPSAFAGNPRLIDLDTLVSWGLLEQADLAGYSPGPQEYAPSPLADPLWRQKLLQLAFERFQAGRAPQLRREFATFKIQEAGWLEDYALFTALQLRFLTRWQAWPEDLRRREPAALARAAQELAAELEAARFSQFLFGRQWRSLKDYAQAKGVAVLGDLPIFVALDSADAWANQELFLLDERGELLAQAGVPPDYFSAEGQLWGNPLYNWEAMRRSGFAWWVARFRRAAELYSLIRIDHFRGLEAYWEVPAGARTAAEGRWVKAPGYELLQTLRSTLGHLPIVAEDLGTITPEVAALRDGFHLPGMAVLQFAFMEPDYRAGPFYPPNVPENRVMYTGTHDNDTARGWWRSAPAEERARAEEYLQAATATEITDENAAWAMLTAAWQSPARLAAAPLQDLLNLGSEARMNIPGQAEGNWRWRLDPSALTPELAARLRSLTLQSGRGPQKGHL